MLMRENICPRWQQREKIYVTFRGRRVEGWIGAASDNGRRLMLEFRAVLGTYAGMMPVMWHDGIYRDWIEGELVRIEKTSGTASARCCR